MSFTSRLASRTALLLCMGTAASAQDAWNFAFKMGGGPLQGQASATLGDAGYSFVGAPEASTKMGGGNLVLDLGYRFFPGDYVVVSQYPAASSYNLTNLAVGTVFSDASQVDKGEGRGWQVTAAYRSAAWTEGLSWQVGLRLGFNRIETTSTGGRRTFRVDQSGANKVLTQTAQDAIADERSKNSTSFGPLAGLHYAFGARYSLEFNGFGVRLDNGGGAKNGYATEVVFGIRF